MRTCCARRRWKRPLSEHAWRWWAATTRRLLLLHRVIAALASEVRWQHARREAREQGRSPAQTRVVWPFVRTRRHCAATCQAGHGLVSAVTHGQRVAQPFGVGCVLGVMAHAQRCLTAANGPSPRPWTCPPICLSSASPAVPYPIVPVWPFAAPVKGFTGVQTRQLCPAHGQDPAVVHPVGHTPRHALP